MDDYAFVDAGEAARLERFGDLLVARPHPAATGPRRAAGRWSDADLRFERADGWRGPGLQAARTGWIVELAGLALELQPTEAGQVGVFPEHAAMVAWLEDQIAERSGAPAEVLNLFAYTGLLTLAAARAGAAVVHVDAARPSVAWARRNAATNGLADRTIRWIVDDARGFVVREVRRGRRYDGILLDPPTYGHGVSGRAWRLDRDLDPLLIDLAALRRPGGFMLLTAHTEGLRPDALGERLAELVDDVEAGALVLTAESGAVLDLGAFARAGGAR